jgi:hypothetical protein
MPNYESVKKYIDLTIQQAGNIENINKITFIVEFPSTFRIEKPTHPSIQTSVQKGSVVTPNSPGPYVTNIPYTNNNHNAFTTPNAPSNHCPFVTPSFHTSTPNTFHAPISVPNNYNIQTLEEFLIEFSRNTITDHKNFLKKEMIPLRGKLPWIIWYKQMVEHGIRHGIYIPPFESLQKQYSWRMVESFTSRHSSEKEKYVRSYFIGTFKWYDEYIFTGTHQDARFFLRIFCII